MVKVKLSMIVPVYNAEKYLEACLESILVGKFDKELVEVLLIDDGSTDRSSDI